MGTQTIAAPAGTKPGDVLVMTFAGYDDATAFTANARSGVSTHPAWALVDSRDWDALDLPTATVHASRTVHRTYTLAPSVPLFLKLAIALALLLAAAWVMPLRMFN